MYKTNFIITSMDNLVEHLKRDTASPKECIRTISKLMDKLTSGCMRGASIDMQVCEEGGVQATGTISLSSFAQNDKITVGNTVLMAKNNPDKSGNQFSLGTNDGEAAANAAKALNTHPNLQGCVTAQAEGSTVTITAVGKLKSGNMTGIDVSAHGSTSGSTLSGGCDPTSYVMSAGL